MKDVFFTVKFVSQFAEIENGVFEDFDTAAAKVVELTSAEGEADYAWVEVRELPQLRTPATLKVVPPAPAPEPLKEKVLDKPKKEVKIK